MTDHQPMPVAGYTQQSDDKIALVNELKAAEERYLRILDKLHALGQEGFAGPASMVLDPRFLALARTSMQEANMWAVRAIFQPQRIKLPEDTP